MAANFPGPYEIRLFYTANPPSGAKNHVLRFSVDVDVEPDPGESFGTFSFLRRNTTPNVAATALDNLLTKIVPLYSTTSTFNRWELWKYTPLSFDAAFITSYTPASGNVGTSASASQEYRQDILTFRSTTGGLAKLDFRNSSSTSIAKDAYPPASADWQAVMDLAAGINTFMLARDGGYFFSPLNWLGGQNEKMFRDINR